MIVEYNRSTCSGWFQCIEEWDAFDMDVMEGKAVLEDADEVETDHFRLEVPPGEEETAVAAAETCPVDAIAIYEDGDQILP